MLARDRKRRRAFGERFDGDFGERFD